MIARCTHLPSRRPFLGSIRSGTRCARDPAFQKLCEEKQPVAPEVLTQSAPEKSIAVLPFENLSSDPDNAYFADGTQNEILTKLAGIGDLKVISRTSTAKYKSKPEDLKTVARELGVATVLEGSVQKAGGKVRVNVQLLDARSDTHLWAKSYDRDLKDVFAVESDVAQEIADALRAKLSPSQSIALAAAPTRDTEAYELFLKGEYQEREAESTYKGEAYDRAATFYRQALTRDPSFVACVCATGLQPLISALVRRSPDVGTIGGGKI